MTVHLHHLYGCAPVPLARYLKALGILRLVAEQKDRSASGFWQDEHFCLLTNLDRVELERFLLDEYSPTPFVSPWNKGSGFFLAGDPALTPLERSTASRFRDFRDGIAAARRPLVALAAADAEVRRLKDRTKAKKGMSTAEKAAAKALREDPAFKAELAVANRRFASLKADLFQPCDVTWRGPHRVWMDAAIVLPEEGKPVFPSLLGTGGNDGRVDFTNNAMQRLANLFDVAGTGGPRPDAEKLLRDALWAHATVGTIPAAIGQFMPSDAGGANSTTGPSGGAFVNPWDFVLMLEGSTLLSARSTRRLDPSAASHASAPFAVRTHAIGHATPGAEKSERGEQWMPLWSRPTTLADLTALLGEARMQLGRTTAYRPLDVARAVARLGAARGVTRYTRFAFLERNGQSNFAVPLGGIDVSVRPRSRLVDDVASWADRLQRLARDKNAPARLVHAERRFANAVFDVLVHADDPARWQMALTSAVSVEAIEAAGTAFEAGPIPPLSPDWVFASNDGSVEWRLACALGSAAAAFESNGAPRDAVRHHWLPLEKGARRFRVREKRLVPDPRVVVTGRDPIGDLLALVERRAIEATQGGQRTLPIVAARGCEARLDDLTALLGSRVDLTRVMALARAFMAVQWDRWHPKSSRRESEDIDEAWAALRLAALPWPLDEKRSVPTDGGIVRRLRAGDASAAVAIAIRRLRSVGISLPLSAATADVSTSRLWGAALAFPISLRTARTLADSLVPHTR